MAEFRLTLSLAESRPNRVLTLELGPGLEGVRIRTPHCGKGVSPVPLTPALAPKERENDRPRGDESKPPDISPDDRQSTLSWGRGLG